MACPTCGRGGVYTADDAAQLLEIPKPTVQRWLRVHGVGRLVPGPGGHRYLLEEADLERLRELRSARGT